MAEADMAEPRPKKPPRGVESSDQSSFEKKFIALLCVIIRSKRLGKSCQVPVNGKSEKLVRVPRFQ